MPISRTFVNKDGETITVTVEDDSRQPCEIWSRVMGYLAVRSQYNEGKKSEFAERKYYSEKAIQPPLF